MTTRTFMDLWYDEERIFASQTVKILPRHFSFEFASDVFSFRLFSQTFFKVEIQPFLNTSRTRNVAAIGEWSRIKISKILISKFLNTKFHDAYSAWLSEWKSDNTRRPSLDFRITSPRTVKCHVERLRRGKSEELLEDRCKSKNNFISIGSTLISVVFKKKFVFDLSVLHLFFRNLRRIFSPSTFEGKRISPMEGG